MHLYIKHTELFYMWKNKAFIKGRLFVNHNTTGVLKYPYFSPNTYCCMQYCINKTKYSRDFKVYTNLTKCTPL